jgi:Uma2 family endonuclease
MIEPLEITSATIVSPTMPAERAKATYEDILALPEGVRGEIIFGVLETQAQPRARHQVTASKLAFLLGPPFVWGRGGPGGWHIIAAPEIHAGGHVLVPDLAGWRTERMPEVPDTAFFSLAPDWVCEILSPSTTKRDRGVKMDAYAEIGVEHVWIVDVDERVLEAFRREGSRWLRIAAFIDGARCRAEPFDAIELELDAAW